MNIIEFNGDPMLQLEKYEDLDKYIFYLNEASYSEIKSYSDEINESIPMFFAGKKNKSILFAKGGIDDDGNEFPDTYIGIDDTDNDDFPFCIASIYASDLQYSKPKNGEIVYLKKTSKKLKNI